MDSVVSANAPLSALVGYSSALRTLSSGKADFAMKFAEYGQMTSLEQKHMLEKMIIKF